MNSNDFIKLASGGKYGVGDVGRLAISILFLLLILAYTTISGFTSVELTIAAIIGGYMAMNIGANDVANNVGPAVGSKALSLGAAIVIAGIFEASGALIAGGDVVSTIKKGIINPESIANADVFIWLMISALLAGAIWLNLATALGAPVSTTHSIVGGVLGAGIAAGGWDVANWSQMGAIAASWVISPVLGGVIAALFLFWIKRSITYRKDMLTCAKKMVPIMVSIMAWAFTTYLLLKGLKSIWKLNFFVAAAIGLAIAVGVYFIIAPMIKRHAEGKQNDKSSINSMFTIPLIFAAALLSFAHGANDVANAVGPLAAISEAVNSGGVATKAPIPLWVMMVGALGIAIGLALFGPKLIRTVGSEITELDPMRAFCIAMAASITVIIASQLGLPVSSTHIAVGGVFGVGFLREHLKVNYAGLIDDIKKHHQGKDETVVAEFIKAFNDASMTEKRVILKQMKQEQIQSTDTALTFKERKRLRKLNKQELVKRSALFKIAAAWVITVPISAGFAALLFFAIRGYMLP